MNYWLNTLLNRFSMYRLLSITLSVMWGMAIFLALLGVLPFSPLAMIVSGSVLILASYLSNKLFGLLFGVRTHDESTYITALILFFIFSPSLIILDVVTLALVATIASTSKYILAVRGRHIFNPAAIAAVIISFTGLTFASWWVATPVLLPITALCAFLILYKTRRSALAGVFLALATPIVLSNYLLNDQTLGEALLALPSWPLLFLVGFMLTEPLTLPPRRRQQLTVAAIVAVLFAVPFNIGALSGSPALALIIGNLAAFLFAHRRKLTLTFDGRKELNSTTSEYTFTSTKPIDFIAGQYMEITVPHTHKDGRGIRRVFSIVGTPGDTSVRFGIRTYDRSSSFKQTLKKLERGTLITATGVGGDFILPKDTSIPLLYIAGGIGITPFISQLLYIQQQNQHRDITLIYSVNAINDLTYTKELAASGIRVIAVVETSQPLPVKTWQHHNHSRINADDLATYIPDIADRYAYISGPPLMVDAMKHSLKKARVKRIKSDFFTGY